MSETPIDFDQQTVLVVIGKAQDVGTSSCTGTEVTRVYAQAGTLHVQYRLVVQTHIGFCRHGTAYPGHVVAVPASSRPATFSRTGVEVQ